MSLSSCVVMGFIFGQGALLNVTVCLGGVDGDRECSRVVFVLVRLGPLVVFFFFFIFFFIFINRYWYSASRAAVRAADSAFDSPASGFYRLKIL